MFGAYVRAGITIAVAVLAAAILGFLIPFFMPFMGPEDELLYQSFEALEEWALFIMLAAVAAGVLARSVVESGVGR